jgi:hypothetical protein
MGSKFVLGFCLGISLALSSGAVAAPEIRFVTELHRNEPYQAHLFHDGVLFVGRTKQADGESHRMEAYSADGKTQLASVALPHTPSFVYAFGPKTVIVVGKSSWPWKTHYSTISWRGTSFKLNTYTFPEKIQVDQFAGKPGGPLFFGETGEAHIYEKRNSGGGFLSPRIALPGMMELVGRSLYVIENNSVFTGDENLVRIDLSTQKAERTFPTTRKFLANLLQLKGGAQLALAETGASQVLLVDAATNQLAETIPVPLGSPRGLAQLGHCLLVAADEARHLFFFDLNTPDKKIVADWDLSVVGFKFGRARDLAVDDLTGRVYVRSAYPCPSCQVSMSSVVVAEEKDQRTFQACKE